MKSDACQLTGSSPWLVVVLALTLAFTLALAAVAGCSSKHLTPEQQAQAEADAYEAQIRKVVTDPARADQLVALTNEFQQQVRESAASLRGYRARVAVLDANYESTKDDYEVVLSQQDAHRETMLEKFAAIRQQMASLTTDAEWEELKTAHLRMLEADLQDLAS